MSALLDTRARLGKGSLAEALQRAGAATHTTLGVRRRLEADFHAQLHRLLAEAGDRR